MPVVSSGKYRDDFKSDAVVSEGHPSTRGAGGKSKVTSVEFHDFSSRAYETTSTYLQSLVSMAAPGTQVNSPGSFRTAALPATGARFR